jgi:hypothetical protein
MAYRVRHLNLGGVLDEAIELVKDNFGLLFSIVLILMAPVELLVGFANATVEPTWPDDASIEEIIRISEQHERANAPLQLLSNLLSIVDFLVLMPIYNGALTIAIARRFLGQPATLRDSIRFGVKRWGSMIGTTILYVLAVMGGTILLIVPGIVFALWFGLFQSIVIVEELGGPTALTRSKHLVGPYVGTYFVLGMISTTIVLALYVPALFIPQPHLAAIGAAVASSITTVLSTAFAVVFYFSCRCGRENFDLQLLANNIANEPEPSNELAFQPAST